MTSETPCVLGCRTITDDIIEAEVFHAEGCPNAPKPAEPRKRVMIVGSGISAALAAVMTAKPAEPPACGCDTFDVMGRSYGHDIGCSNHAKPEPQSEPRIEHRDVCHASYPCEDCGKVRSRAEGGTTFTVCDDCWDKRQSEPPIDWDAAERWATERAGALAGLGTSPDLNLSKSYLALKAERDILKLALAEESGYLKRASAERDALKVECDELAANVCDYSELNSALKARVEELSESLLWATSSYEERVVILANREKRKEQENTNAR